MPGQLPRPVTKDVDDSSTITHNTGNRLRETNVMDLYQSHVYEIFFRDVSILRLRAEKECQRKVRSRKDAPKMSEDMKATSEAQHTNGVESVIPVRPDASEALASSLLSANAFEQGSWISMDEAVLIVGAVGLVVAALFLLDRLVSVALNTKLFWSLVVTFGATVAALKALLYGRVKLA